MKGLLLHLELLKLELLLDLHGLLLLGAKVMSTVENLTVILLLGLNLVDLVVVVESVVLTMSVVTHDH